MEHLISGFIMMDFHFDKVRWLLENELFRQWIATGDSALERHWESWLAGHPESQEALAHAKTLLQEMQRELPVLSDEHIDQRVSQLITRLESESADPAVRPLYHRARRWAAAASVVLFLGAGWLYYYYEGRTSPATYGVAAADQPGAGKELPRDITNNGDTPQTINLPDESLVRLEPGSRLQFPAAFSGPQRDVYLTGEAFFEVAHDASHPFWVHAHGLNTKVLGTSFTVRAYAEAAQASVKVHTGRVSVYTTEAASRHSSGSSLVLTPNQQAVLTLADNQLKRSLVEQPQVIAAADDATSFKFQRTPLPSVLRALENAYGIEIIYDEQALQACSLTATLGDESLWDKLRWICAGTGSAYEVIDGHIVFDGPGCAEP
ncbi:MAG: hypothetical protein ABS46_01235 [Cytophagaceae bacterium SCN 52-12]|nr:MAG: hypothetical protein ABS46_01235 [Cytophagaceae bacterium SCN 52-12]